tara:strand:- start:204 stop:545 length:342 start_codon:yes stop_codon:yes gene_type:complete
MNTVMEGLKLDGWGLCGQGTKGQAPVVSNQRLAITKETLRWLGHVQLAKTQQLILITLIQAVEKLSYRIPLARLQPSLHNPIERTSRCHQLLWALFGGHWPRCHRLSYRILPT